MRCNCLVMMNIASIYSNNLCCHGNSCSHGNSHGDTVTILKYIYSKYKYTFTMFLRLLPWKRAF